MSLILFWEVPIIHKISKNNLFTLRFGEGSALLFTYSSSTGGRALKQNKLKTYSRYWNFSPNFSRTTGTLKTHYRKRAVRASRSNARASRPAAGERLRSGAASRILRDPGAGRGRRGERLICGVSGGASWMKPALTSYGSTTPLTLLICRQFINSLIYIYMLLTCHKS